MADTIKTALEFWQKIYDEREGTVKFVKKDGTIRIMRFTLDFTKIPKNDHPKKIDLVKIMKTMNEKGIIHVYDLDKILDYGVMITPALVVDGELKISGKLPGESELLKAIS